jgi:predicted DNA-binding transcriptional regulator AlpA
MFKGVSPGMRENKSLYVKLGTFAAEYDIELPTLHLLIRKGSLPEPQKIDARSWGWRRSDLVSWARERERD